MKILLVHPDFGGGDFGFRMAAMPEPLGLEMLAAALPGHDVRIADLRCKDDLATIVREFGPDVVGVTALTPEVYKAQAVLRDVKAISSDIVTVAGGHHATLLPEDFDAPDVDVITLGEGEVVLAELIVALEAGSDLGGVANLRYQLPDGTFKATQRKVSPVNLNESRLPRRDLTAQHRDEYFFLFDRPDTSIASGRGCPYRCNFCSVWEFYNGRTRMMSPERVLAELRTISTNHITFVDDNFLLNAEREGQIADMIKAEGIQKRYSMECRSDSIIRHPELVRKWAELGLYGVLLGLEGSDKMLASVGKASTLKTNDEAIRILQDLDIIIWGAFIADPTWDVDDFRRLSDYVTSRRITHTQFTVLTPLPGTALHRQCWNKLITDDYTCFDALHAVVETRLPREQFYQEFARLYQQNGADAEVLLNYLRNGKVTGADLKRGNRMLQAMGNWENFAANDPVLRTRPHQQLRTRSLLRSCAIG